MRNMINIVKISLKEAVWTQEQFTMIPFNIIAMEYYRDDKKKNDYTYFSASAQYNIHFHGNCTSSFDIYKILYD